MTEALQNFLTIDEAVAILMNLDSILKDFSLEEQLSAFVEAAEVDLENSIINDASDVLENNHLSSRLKACRTRLELARSLRKDIEVSIEGNFVNEYGDQLKSLTDSRGILRVEKDSLRFWAGSEYGIDVSINNAASTECVAEERLNWEDITIYIRDRDRIGFKLRDQKETIVKAYDIGFGHKRHETTNKFYKTLLDLAQGYPYPPDFRTRKAYGKEKTHMHNLRERLKNWIEIDDDPFEKYDPEFGWKPRFKLKDRTEESNKRAERKAIHLTYTDDEDHDDHSFE